MSKLDGKIALITGGSEDIGFGTACEFIKEGAFVFITGRRKPQLDEAIAKLGPQAFGIQADAGKLADLDRMYAEIKERGVSQTSFSPMRVCTSRCLTIW